MKFTKMQGCGNDYVYVNGFTEKLSPEEKPEIVRSLSDRHFGIGGDGVIFINPAEEADFEMEMYNADGSRSEMCGNGIRCVAKYVYDKGLTDKKDITIVSAGKIKYLKLTVEGKTATDRGQVTLVQVNMGNPILAPAEVPVTVEATQETADGPAVVNAPIMVDDTEYHMTCVSMGNPHAIVFMEGGYCTTAAGKCSDDLLRRRLWGSSAISERTLLASAAAKSGTACTDLFLSLPSKEDGNPSRPRSGNPA